MAMSTSGQSNNFVLSAQVPDTPGLSGVEIKNLVGYHPTALISKGFQSFGQGISTFMDSGASNTMFVSREMFTEYTPIVLRVGDSAKAVDGSLKLLVKERLSNDIESTVMKSSFFSTCVYCVCAYSFLFPFTCINHKANMPFTYVFVHHVSHVFASRPTHSSTYLNQ